MVAAAGAWHFHRPDLVCNGRPAAGPSCRWFTVPARCAITTDDQRLVQDVLHFGLVDPDIRALARKKLEALDHHGSRSKWALVAGVGLAAATGPLVVLKCLGFKGATIAAGSWAAWCQPAEIATGSWFAWAQSTAATGGLFTKLGLVSSGSTWAAWSHRTQPANKTDEELLTALVEKELVDYEVRNLLLEKLRSRLASADGVLLRSRL